MKKKIIYIVIILIVALLFSACMNNNDPQLPISSETAAETDTETSSESAEKSGEDDEKGFVFMYEGHEIYMGMPEEEIKLLEEYTNPGLAQNEVLMIRYEFDSFYVDCSKWFLSKDPFTVTMIYFKDNIVETMEGIRLGDSLEKVRDTYKNDEVYYSSEHEIHYLRDNSILTFSFTDNKVTEILYELYEE